MTKQELIMRKEKVFYDDFTVRPTASIEDIKDFCSILTNVTGIQCCTTFGYMNELLEKSYNSVLNTL